MIVEEIEYKGNLLAYIIHGNYEVKGKRFFGNTTDFIQVGMMELAKGTELKPHYHLPQRKMITKNQEVLIILSGKIEVSFFNVDKDCKINSCILNSGDIIVLLDGAHGFNMIEDTKLIEVKQGPYTGRDSDKKYLEVEK